MFTARTWDFAHKSTWSKMCELWISVRSRCSQNSIEGKEKLPTEGANSTGQWAQANGQRICSSRLSICSSRLSICSSRLSICSSRLSICSSGRWSCFSLIWSSGPYMEYVLCAHMSDSAPARACSSVLPGTCELFSLYAAYSSYWTFSRLSYSSNVIFIVCYCRTKQYPYGNYVHKLGHGVGISWMLFDMKPPRLAVVIFPFIRDTTTYLSATLVDPAW